MISTNHDLARAAAEKIEASEESAGRLFTRDEIVSIIADTYVAPLAELERLRRQVKLATESTNVCYYEMGDYYYCEFCSKSHSDQYKLVHHPDCPHNEEPT